MNLLTVKRFLTTIYYLKPIQVYFRLWSKLYRPIALSTLPKDFKANLSPKNQAWKIFSSNKKILADELTFILLGKKFKIIPNQWFYKEMPMLWNYNLNYFDFLFGYEENKVPSNHLEFLITSWINSNSWGSRISWDPYPISLRLVNWVKYAFINEKHDYAFSKSIFEQTQYLNQRIEYHLQGNHLLANAKGLIFGGIYLYGFTTKFFSRGVSLFCKELEKQILADGGHYELSPMYHAIILNDVLDIIYLSKIHPKKFSSRDIEYLKKIAKKMMKWLTIMSHSSGEVGYFNDSVNGIAKDLNNLLDYSIFLGISQPKYISSAALLDSGYFRLVNKSQDILCICDLGNLGPNHQLGHAHADTMSFELSVNNQKVIGNLGISTYENNQVRHMERSTSSHSTLEINHQNSSDVWHAFRVARRSFILERSITKTKIQASHNGYRYLPGNPIHSREFSIFSNSLIIDDFVKSKEKLQNISLYFHILPGFCITQISPKELIIGKTGLKISFFSSTVPINLIDTSYNYSYGDNVKSTSLKLSISDIDSLESKIIITNLSEQIEK